MVNRTIFGTHCSDFCYFHLRQINSHENFSNRHVNVEENDSGLKPCSDWDWVAGVTTNHSRGNAILVRACKSYYHMISSETMVSIHALHYSDLVKGRHKQLVV